MVREQMDSCKKCGKRVEGWKLTFDQCPECYESAKALTHKPDLPVARWGNLQDGLLDDLMEDRQLESPKKREPLEAGYSTFVRDEGDETFLICLQLWVEQKPILVLRFNDDLHLLRFQKIPTTKYQRIVDQVQGKYRLLSNGPLVETDYEDLKRQTVVGRMGEPSVVTGRKELGPSVAEILKIVRQRWEWVTQSKHWSVGEFRKQKVLILALALDSRPAIDGIVPVLEHTLKFLEDLRGKKEEDNL
jgi:hypothetical protein